MVAGADKLVVTLPDLEQRMQGLVAKLGADKALMSRFETEPTQVLLKEVVPEYNAADFDARLSTSNTFLMSALANDGFRNWAANYQKELAERTRGAADLGAALPDRKQILDDIAAALVASQDKQLVSDWSEHIGMSGTVTVTDDIAVVTKAVIALVVLVTAIDFTPFAPEDPNGGVVAASDVRALSDALVASAKRHASE